MKSNQISILALTVAETADYGILRLIVDDPEACFVLLKKNDILAGKTEIFAIEMKDSINGLDEIAVILGENGVNIEYMYMLPQNKRIILMIQVSDEHEQTAAEIFRKNTIHLFDISELGG